MEGQLDEDASVAGGSTDAASNTPQSQIPTAAAAAAVKGKKQVSDSRESLSDEFFKKNMNSDKLPAPPSSSFTNEGVQTLEDEGDDDSISFGIRSKDINTKQRETFAAVANMKAKLCGMGILSKLDDTEEEHDADLVHHFAPPLPPPPPSASAVKNLPKSASKTTSASAAALVDDSTVVIKGLNTMMLDELQISSGGIVSSSGILRSDEYAEAVMEFKVADLKMRTDKFKESLR